MDDIGTPMNRTLVFISLSLIAAAVFVAIEVDDVLHNVLTQPDRSAQVPQSSPADNGMSNVFYRHTNGHFIVTGYVNSVPIEFLVDTGATNVVLSMTDASKLGFFPEDQDFIWRFTSANGDGKAAPITLAHIGIGQSHAWDVQGAVIQSDIPYSLLGQSYLSKIKGFEIAGNRLTLH